MWRGGADFYTVGAHKRSADGEDWVLTRGEVVRHNGEEVLCPQPASPDSHNGRCFMVLESKRHMFVYYPSKCRWVPQDYDTSDALPYSTRIQALPTRPSSHLTQAHRLPPPLSFTAAKLLKRHGSTMRQRRIATRRPHPRRGRTTGPTTPPSVASSPPHHTVPRPTPQPLAPFLDCPIVRCPPPASPARLVSPCLASHRASPFSASSAGASPRGCGSQWSISCLASPSSTSTPSPPRGRCVPLGWSRGPARTFTSSC